MNKSNVQKPSLCVAIFSIIAIFCLVVTLPLLGCDKQGTDTPKAGNGFISAALIWEDKFDTADEISSVHFWVYDKTGNLAIEKKFHSATELAMERFVVQAGVFHAVVAVNLNEDIADADKATAEDLLLELARQAALYEQMFYGDKTAEAVNGESRAVYISLTDKPADDSLTCERCKASFETEAALSDHLLPCGGHKCAEGITLDEHTAAACNTDGHFKCDGKTHTAAACNKTGHYNCDTLNHSNPGCGHYGCEATPAHTQLECQHFSCAAGNHSKLDCGHFACLATGDHSAADCKTSGHFKCDGKNHTRLDCESKHFACDKNYGLQACGHCLCDGNHLCPVCKAYICRDNSESEYFHETYQCGHIFCGRFDDGGMAQQGHTECQYCWDCETFGEHGDGICNNW